MITLKKQHNIPQHCAHTPVQVGLRVLWEVEVDNNVHGLDVDTSSEEVCVCVRCVWQCVSVFVEVQTGQRMQESRG